jgi:hypothetical protein|tara:strand:+ start:5293 stop:5700 length:408 start_codon:yes stop_codon:yes gene_type:complete
MKGFPLRSRNNDRSQGAISTTTSDEDKIAGYKPISSTEGEDINSLDWTGDVHRFDKDTWPTMDQFYELDFDQRNDLAESLGFNLHSYEKMIQEQDDLKNETTDTEWEWAHMVSSDREKWGHDFDTWLESTGRKNI